MDKLVDERDGGFFYVEWVGEPCPWCGCAGVSGKSPEGHFFAGCPDADCLAHNLAYDFVTVDHARSAWDARAAIAQKRVNELEDALASIRMHCEPQPSPLAKAIVATCNAALPTMLKGNGDGQAD